MIGNKVITVGAVWILGALLVNGDTLKVTTPSVVIGGDRHPLAEAQSKGSESTTSLLAKWYPLGAIQRTIENQGIEDQVNFTVRVIVNKNGTVESAELTKSTGNQSVDKRVIKSVRRWLFDAGSSESISFPATLVYHIALDENGASLSQKQEG